MQGGSLVVHAGSLVVHAGSPAHAGSLVAGVL